MHLVLLFYGTVQLDNMGVSFLQYICWIILYKIFSLKEPESQNCTKYCWRICFFFAILLLENIVQNMNVTCS
uniref:Uncharacterized protein n=1 Tax=Arundo donax TaxID=35708 RepID=A0A0A9CJQ0_ARUDO